MSEGCTETRGVVIRFDHSRVNKDRTVRQDATLVGFAQAPSPQQGGTAPATELAGEERTGLAARVQQAMTDWGGRSEESAQPLSPENRDRILRTLPALVMEIRNDCGLDRPVTDARARRALHTLFGDVSLRHLALMTPQGILALPGCGRSVLDRVIRELSRVSALTIPEIVTGTGKAGIERIAFSQISEDLEGLLPALPAFSAPTLPSRPRLI